MQVTHQGNTCLFDCIMKFLAVRWLVIKAQHSLVLEVAVIIESGIETHAMSDSNQFVIDAVDLVTISQSPCRDDGPRFLAHRTICRFCISRHLWHGLFLAVEGDGHCSADFAVFLIECGRFGLQRNVLCAKETDFLAHRAQICFVSIWIELLCKWTFDNFSVKLCAGCAKVWFDILHEL